jgi:hypothetical protein
LKLSILLREGWPRKASDAARRMSNTFGLNDKQRWMLESLLNEARKLAAPASASTMEQRLEKILAEGHCNDTCSHSLSDVYECDCWKAKVRAALRGTDSAAKSYKEE